MTSRHTIIRDVLVVPGAGETPFYGWVATRDGAISACGRDQAPVPSGAEIIDGAGGALVPGFVNTHAHSHSSLTRGSAEGVALEDWLTVIEREQSRLTKEQATVGALATYAEALLSGTTTMMDMCLHPDAAYAAAREIGMRAVIAPYVADGKSFTPTLADTAALIEEGARFDERVRVWVGLHDLESCSDAQIVEGVKLAKARNVGLHLHCSESMRSVDRTRTRTGRTPVAQLAELGVLSERTVLAHCVWVDDHDRALLAASGTHVAHCPHANLKLGSGVAPIPDLCAKGINVTLATDGAKANNRLDPFDVMKFASLLPKGVARNPAALPPRHIFDMATRRGAVALGVPAGAIAPGLAADLVLMRADGFHLQPMLPETVETNLVHAARGSDVSMVMVAGRVLVRGGRLAEMDQDDIMRKARAVGLHLIKQDQTHGAA
jgi:5-methylthioadenosine/S-adenosylhomocysteine deaminase